MHPMEAIWDSTNYWAARQMLDASQKAQEVYAANLAHVNTPGYQRREVDGAFLETLRQQLATGSTDPARVAALKTRIDADAAPNSPSGNSAALTRELQAIQSNALTYNFLTRYASGRFSKLQMAITGRL